MTQTRLLSFLVLALLGAFCGKAGEQSHAKGQSTEQQILLLTNANSGQRVAAVVGQRIEITLATTGPGNFGTPEISSAAVRFWNVAFPRLQSPGGPTQVYLFQGAVEGEAEVTIPHTERAAFSVIVQVRSSTGKSLNAVMTADQENTAAWKGGWTNLMNDVRQTFTPSMPKLTGVEVQLVVANPGPEEEEVTLRLLNASGEVLATVSRTVPAAECCRVLFVFPGAGLDVTPGEVYSIAPRAESLFGWKYVAGGYATGEASFNGRSLLPQARSTFLFRTFGAD